MACSINISNARCANPQHHAPICRRRMVSRSCIGAKPCPISPSTCELGIRQSSKTTSYVRWPPNIGISRATSKPGVPLSSKNAVIPPRAPLSGSVTAIRMEKSAFFIRDTQIFRPLMTQSSPSLTARVRIPAGSPPAPGSEIAMAELISPLAYGSRYFLRCSSFAVCIIMCKFGESGGKVNGTAVRLSASFTATRLTESRSAPPMDSGTSNPQSPSSLQRA